MEVSPRLYLGRLAAFHNTSKHPKAVVEHSVIVKHSAVGGRELEGVRGRGSRVRRRRQKLKNLIQHVKMSTDTLDPLKAFLEALLRAAHAVKSPGEFGRDIKYHWITTTPIGPAGTVGFPDTTSTNV